MKKLENGLQKLQELASLRGGKCLSGEYVSSRTKYQWVCAEGHVWEARFNDIRKGHWCNKCHMMQKEKHLDFLHALASKYGGLCLSHEYVDSKTKYQWQCKEGHVWAAKANDVQQSSWCPECAGCKKHDIAWLHELAANNGGKCLSVEYVNVSTKYQWQCSEGHVWKAEARNVQRKRWCPFCFNRHSKAELRLYEFVKKSFPDAINGQMGLLKSKGFELDIYIPSINKAIEYDGAFWHKSEWAVGKGKPEIDARKGQQCLDAGIELLRVDEDEYLNNPGLVEQKVIGWLND
jgi:hypothetical protein